MDFILQRRGREGDYARALSRLCRCGDLLAFLFSRVCTRALSRATQAPPARNTPSSSTVFQHTAAACDPITSKDHTSKHRRTASQQTPQIHSCVSNGVVPSSGRQTVSTGSRLQLAHGQGAAEAGRRRRQEPEPSSALALCPQSKRPTLSSTSRPCRSG